MYFLIHENTVYHDNAHETADRLLLSIEEAEWTEPVLLWKNANAKMSAYELFTKYGDPTLATHSSLTWENAPLLLETTRLGEEDQEKLLKPGPRIVLATNYERVIVRDTYTDNESLGNVVQFDLRMNIPPNFSSYIPFIFGDNVHYDTDTKTVHSKSSFIYGAVAQLYLVNRSLGEHNGNTRKTTQDLNNLMPIILKESRKASLFGNRDLPGATTLQNIELRLFQLQE